MKLQFSLLGVASLLSLGFAVPYQPDARQNKDGTAGATPISSPTATSAASTTISSAVPTKTSVADCNVEGLPSAAYTARLYGNGTQTDVLACQYACRYITACISYSWAPAATSYNCVLYNAWMREDSGPGNVIAQNGTGVFYSDKYPLDGTDFCYGNASLS